MSEQEHGARATGPSGRNRRHRHERSEARISWHAVERWGQRVGGGPGEHPSAELHRFLATGRRRPRPRHWTRARSQPGTLFVYSSERPGVCVIVREGVALTVVTRVLCRGAAA